MRAPQIVGGTVAAPDTWPWTVRIDLVTPDGILFPPDGQPDVDFQGCAGSLIGARWVLTAGHCLLLFGEVIGGPGFVPGIHFRLVIGETHLHGAGDPANEYVVEPDDVIALHPAAGALVGSDLALLRLPRPAPQRALRIVGVSGDDRVQLAPGTLVTATGWGTMTDGGADLSEDLRQIDVPLVSDRDCAFAYPTVEFEGGLTVGFEANTMICAGAAGKDTCQGDSGGPLMAPDGAGGWVQIGITSWGVGCGLAGLPGVYGRLSGLFGFILTTLRDDREAPAGPPQASTDRVVNVKQKSARVLGQIVPNGLATVYVIEWGTNRRYLGGRIQAYAGAGSSAALIAGELRGLKPGRTYHVRVSAMNLSGETDGSDLVFKTKPARRP